MTTLLTDRPVHALPPARFEGLVDEESWSRTTAAMERAGELLRGRAVWNVTSRARSGGVVELVSSLTALARGAGIDARWEVIDAGDDFFHFAKRLHNNLHGRNGDGEAYGDAERRIYEEALGERLHLVELVAPGDVVVLHDPQTAGLTPLLKEAGAQVIWRCHVGLDSPNDLTRRAWRFLGPYLERADAFVFSRPQFLWEDMDRGRAHVIRPSLNPLSPKNQELDPGTVDAILAVTRLQPDGPLGDTSFVRLDGTPGRVDRTVSLAEDEPLPPDVPLLLQVSHWNHLKDPVGVVQMFAEEVAPECEAHLVIAGPDIAGVGDEPEARDVYQQTLSARERLDRPARSRVHIATVPIDDPEESAATINALQRRAAVALQKSRGEGFGMTVLEAMWKGRPTVCSRVGGLQEQVIDGVTGYLLDPGDQRGAGRRIVELVADPRLRQRMGAAGHARVRSEFLLPREGAEWVDLLNDVVGREH